MGMESHKVNLETPILFYGFELISFWLCKLRSTGGKNEGIKGYIFDIIWLRDLVHWGYYAFQILTIVKE